MNETEALAALDARSNYERDGRLGAPKIDRMRALMELLANPEKQAPAIHITGTNGKTTCAWACAAMLRAAGLSVGTYVSPHLVHVRERIAHDGEPISPEDFAATYEYVAPFLDVVDARGERVTWFEAMTAMAYVWFADKAVDATVIEVGMGGTWDATNVVDGRVAVITEVALDHPELGSTTVEIAGEKVGIIKDGAAVVTGERDPAVLEVIERASRDRGARLHREGAAFAIERRTLAVGGQQIDLRLGGRLHAGLFLPLFGERMARDAAIGAAAAWALLGERDLDHELLAEGFATMRAPGRMEVVRRRPLVVLDGAHNPAAAEALVAALGESFTWDRLIVVLGMLSNKDARGVIAALASVADDVLVARVSSPRGAPAEALLDEALAHGLRARRVASIPGALALALEQASDSDCVLVAGSLYTVGEAKVLLASRT